MGEKFLITGGQGFLGSWIARLLLEEKTPFILLDRMPSNSILAQVIEPEPLSAVPRLFAGPADTGALERALRVHGVTRLIHLAGFTGSSAVGLPAGGLERIVYLADPLGAEQEKARGSFRDHGIPSIGLRAAEVYGVGSGGAPTLAIRAAVLGRRFNIPWSGVAAFTYAEDAARTFIAAARSAPGSPRTFNLLSETVPVESFIVEISRRCPEAQGAITAEGEPLSVPLDLEESDLDDLLGAAGARPATPLAEGIRKTVEMFRALAAEGRLFQA
jgi:nucleoside-diphosphate-sugar epimerase